MRGCETLYRNAKGTLIFTILVWMGSFLLFPTQNSASAQNMTLQQQPSLRDQLLEQQLNPNLVEITSPLSNSTFPIGSNNSLTIIGTSSDNSTRNCRVEYILNNISSTNTYDNVSAAGPGGIDDFSLWNRTITPDKLRTILSEGPNKITARLSCSLQPGPSAEHGLPKHFSIQLIGIGTAVSNATNLNVTGSSLGREGGAIAPGIANATTAINATSNPLSISMNVLSDPIELGDDQNIVVRLNDASGRQVIPALARFTILGSSGEPVDEGGFWGPNLINATSIIYDLEIDDDAELGNFTATVEAWTYATGLQPSSKTIQFEVVEELGE